MELAGKRVVITGASRGIGAEIARVFASAGSQVVVSARTESAITELASEVGGVAFLLTQMTQMMSEAILIVSRVLLDL